MSRFLTNTETFVPEYLESIKEISLRYCTFIELHVAGPRPQLNLSIIVKTSI